MIRSVELLRCPAGWRTWLFLKIATDDVVGWSEVTESNGSPLAIEGAVRDLAHLVVGRNADWEAVTRDLYLRTRQSPGGVVGKAIGAIQNALIDVKAKELGIPVYELFGGVNKTIPVYWSHCGTNRMRTEDSGIRTYDDIEALADEVCKKGYSALKTNCLIPGSGVQHPGFGKRGEVKTDDVVRLVEAFQRGGDADVILDLNFNVDPNQAREISERVNLLWLEYDSYHPESLKYLKDHSPNPICSCENILGTNDYRRYVESVNIGSVDVIWNGLGEAKKIADLCHDYDLPITPHNYYSHLSTFISAHFSMIANVNLLEVDVDDVPWKDEVTTRCPDISYGSLTIPKAPGWGCDVDERFLRNSGAPIRP